jgi:hypothetical protein
MDEPKINETPTHSIPCALCGIAPARIEYGVQATALGLGEITVYLCQADYMGLLERQRASQARDNERERRQEHFEQVRQQIEATGLRLYGGQWPPRLTLLEEYKETGKQHDQARSSYRLADDSKDEGHLARLRVLHKAGLCLYQGICIEAVAALEGKGDSVVSGFLTSATYAFMRKGGHIIAEKTITREQIIAACLAVLCYRETHPEASEDDELAAIDRER